MFVQMMSKIVALAGAVTVSGVAINNKRDQSIYDDLKSRCKKDGSEQHCCLARECEPYIGYNIEKCILHFTDSCTPAPPPSVADTKAGTK